MWKLIGSGTYTTGEQGAEALYAFDVQDFGLQVDTVLFALEVEAASSGTVQVRLHEDHGASPDFEGYVTSGVDPIAATPVGEPVVQTLLGSTTLSVPYFRTSLGVSAGPGEDGSVTVRLYAGGRTR